MVMGQIPGWMLRHRVQVELPLGEGALGQTYGAAREVRCFREDRRRLVRSKDGSEVISETTLWMRLSEACPVDARVTLPAGPADARVTTVITSSPRDGGGLPTPDHLEVTLT